MPGWGKAEANADKAPDDLSELLMCPTCGHRRLAGILEVQGKWLKCTECRFCVSDTPSIRLWLINAKGSM